MASHDDALHAAPVSAAPPSDAATVRAVVFDIGNVLIRWDPRNLYRNIFETTAEMEHFLSSIVGMGWVSQMDAGKPWAQGVAELSAQYPEFAAQISAFDTRWHETVGGEIPEAVDLLLRIARRGIPCYGLTNFAAEKFAETVPHHTFFQAFKGVVVSGREGCIKPDQRIFDIMIARYDLDPAHTLFIDDNPANVATAERMGFITHRFTEPAHLLETAAGLRLYP
ncbi:MAG: HAD family phosphatase [Pseudomonadota bacterium]